MIECFYVIRDPCFFFRRQILQRIHRESDDGAQRGPAQFLNYQAVSDQSGWVSQI